ncbi:hypothetical protein GCM10023212_41020 [Luteolibacter yonseiensis]
MPTQGEIIYLMKDRNKQTTTAAVQIINHEGRPILDEDIYIIADESSPLPESAPRNAIAITRRQLAWMVREWRNDPATPKSRKNSPTVSELMARLVLSLVGGAGVPA